MPGILKPGRFAPRKYVPNTVNEDQAITHLFEVTMLRYRQQQSICADSTLKAGWNILAGIYCGEGLSI